MHIQHPVLREGVVEFRGYQVNLARVAGARNTLVVLPTGMGKTVVALLVLADLLRDGGQRVLVLAPTKPLVEQHGRFLEATLAAPWNDRVTVLTGAISPTLREEKTEGPGIICATPQVIANDVVGGRLDLASFDLIVFDEAHRAVGDYPYVFLGQEALRRNTAGRRLGLTASPGHEVRRIDEVRTCLGLRHAEIRTPLDPDVSEFVQDVDTQWEVLPLPPSLLRVSGRLEEIQAEKVRQLKHLGVLKTGGSKPNRKELLEAGQRLQARMRQTPNPPPELYQGLSLQAQAMKLAHAVELAQTQGAQPFLEFAAKLDGEESKASRVLSADRRMQEARQIARFADDDNPKMRRTEALVSKQVSKNPDSRVIVFAHFRGTCEQVVAQLEKIEGVRPVLFVGQGRRGGAEGMTQKKQAETVAAFTEGTFNVLVATSVGEEGLDIPETDLVLFYEPIPSEIRSIQRRGRTGRKRAGNVVVLITKGTKDEAAHWTARRKEAQMVRELQQLRSQLQVASAAGAAPDDPTPGRVGEAAGLRQAALGDAAPRPQAPEAPASAVPAAAPGAGTRPPTSTAAAPGLSPGPKIICDAREQAGAVVRMLHERGAAVEVRTLEVADYVLSDRVAVERKEGRDFVDSLVDGRLFEQVRALAAYPKPILIVEGSLYGHRGVSEEALLGAVGSIGVDFGVSVLQTADARETAALLHAIARREQGRAGRKVAVRPGRTAMSDRERALYLLEGLPHISATLAPRVLEHFGSVAQAFSAPAAAWSAIEGIGNKTAAEVRRVIDAVHATGAATVVGARAPPAG